MRLFVDNLTNVDFSYLHPQRGLLGETWLASTHLQGALDAQGMVCDFGVVKKTLRNWLDQEIDHRLAVPALSPHLTITEAGDQLLLRWHYNGGVIECESPRQAIALVNTTEITPDSVSRWSIDQLKPLLPDTIDRLALDFALEAIDGEFYHYSHGLKKHAGNCQRIAHGHRSTLRIWRDDERAPDWEAQWAQTFTDIYIGTRADLVEQTASHNHFAYQTSQGSFALTLPHAACYLIDSDSTVELIARHIADTIAARHPQHRVRVKAFEGLGKGAIVER